MTATNINIEEFIAILNGLKSGGVKFVNLNMLPDEARKDMNKIVIDPVKDLEDYNTTKVKKTNKDSIIKNPEVRTDNNDIFNLFNSLI